jgi:hypothetical protein
MHARLSLSLLLAVFLGLTSAAAGHARATPQQAQVIVICTGAGLTTIVLGPDGAPVERRAPCPDCTLVAVGTAPDQPAPHACDADWHAAPALPEPPAHARAATAPAPPARAPPIP